MNNLIVQVKLPFKSRYFLSQNFFLNYGETCIRNFLAFLSSSQTQFVIRRLSTNSYILLKTISLKKYIANTIEFHVLSRHDINIS